MKISTHVNLLVACSVFSWNCVSDPLVCPDGVISSITIDNNNVFDQEDPKENGAFYRTANFFHLTTRKRVVRSQLIFNVGDCYSERLADEAGRILRTNRYIRKARIYGSRNLDGTIDVFVNTSDTWSTKIKLAYSHHGGENKTQFGIQEKNLLGLGIDLGLLIKKDIDRDSTAFKLSDKTLFGTKYQLDLGYSDNSDGFLQSISLENPFYSLDTRNSYGIAFQNEEKENSYFFEGDRYFTYFEKYSSADVYYGWSEGLKNNQSIRHRLGFRMNDRNYDDISVQPEVTSTSIQDYLSKNNLTPDDIDEQYPYYSIDYLEDAYDTIKNYDQIARIEDRYTGLGMGLSLGYVSASLSEDDISQQDYWKFSGYINNLFPLTKKTSITAQASLVLELHDYDIKNALESHSLQLYHRQSERFTTYLNYVSVRSHELRKGQQVFLDAETGLRGYPLRYLSGERTQKFTIEQRYFFHNDLFRLFNFGAAAFLDVGSIYGGTEFEREKSGIYRSIGVGLRIANNRSSEGTIVHLDLTKPLDKEDESGFQFSIITHKKF